ncbi:alpha/beta fold hydrolase [Ancylobacter sp. TS-1]|uniref:alpha/beta fold hydrolase n=1 Tax=Ancylobacter sp. TS-1 TaxID=1850374 RepID=UPI0013916597|nr:alpha/beta hydrolase [Ancylobacter sp. TS-1]
MTPPEAAAFIDIADARATRSLTGTAGEEIVWRRFGHGPPLVLLHGGFGSWLHWLPVVALLEPHFQLMIPDMPGFGGSAPIPVGTTPGRLAEQLAAGLDALLPSGSRLDLAGFSFGGLVATHLAKRLDGRVGTLALVAGGGLGAERDPVDLRGRRPDMSEDERREVAAHNLRAFMIADATRVDALAVEIQQRNTSRRPGLVSRDFSRSRTALALLPELDARVAAIWGTQDPTVGGRLADRRRAVEAAARSAMTAELPGCGHWIMQERPAELAAFLIDAMKPDQPAGQKGWNT